MATKALLQGFAARSSRRGASFVEALIMLPVFTIIFFGVVHIKQLVVAAEKNLSKARECAWTYSNAGCRGDLPEACSRDSQTPFTNTPDTLFQTGAAFNPPPSADKSEVGGGGKECTADPNTEGGKSKICDQLNAAKQPKSGEAKQGGALRGKMNNFLDDIVDFFENDRQTLAVKSDIDSSRILGNRRTSVSAAFRVSCNTVPKTIGEVLWDFFKSVNPF